MLALARISVGMGVLQLERKGSRRGEGEKGSLFVQLERMQAMESERRSVVRAWRQKPEERINELISRISWLEEDVLDLAGAATYISIVHLDREDYGKDMIASTGPMLGGLLQIPIVEAKDHKRCW